MLIKICKTLGNEDLIKKLTEGRRYLKGNYRAHCTADDCHGVADYCIKYTLSDEKSEFYQSNCGKIHNKSCFECDTLSQTLLDVKTLAENATGIMKEERHDLNYDATQCVHNILLWKAHVLTTINQDIAKQQILERLDNSTAFVIIDFAMKFLARRHRESMRSWFGKAGMRMHVSCVIMKDDSSVLENPEAAPTEEERFRKRTYITFIGKAPQDVGSVIAIYQSLLHQLQIDFPNIKYIIDKPDNACCYHNEVLFIWKAT